MWRDAERGSSVEAMCKEANGEVIAEEICMGNGRDL